MTGRNITTRGLGLGALAALAGCVLLDGARTVEVVYGFDHAIHLEEGLECIGCHGGVEEADEPGQPALALCVLCHEGIDEDQPPERHVETLFDGKIYRTTDRTRLSEEVRFSHLAHVNGGLACEDCHAGIGENRRVVDLPRVDMDVCVACHVERGQSADDCAICHDEVDADWTPPTHDGAWTRRHGDVFRSRPSAVEARCSLCHSESACNSCHAEVPPEGHNEFWRRRGHGVSARIDRATCATCHRSDSCERCHQETRPTNHTGTLGGTRSTHCLTCHFPLRAEGCLTCHKDTPSHSSATPLPLDPKHSLALNCRQCHGVTAPLPHVDKGDECIACHR